MIRNLFGGIVPSTWDIGKVQQFDMLSSVGSMKGLFFTTEGFDVFVVGGTNDNIIYHYRLYSAWDIKSATIFRSLTLAGTYGDIYFSGDGKNMYLYNYAAFGEVHQYTLSTAWNISTSVFLQTLPFSLKLFSTVTNVDFSSNGEFMYISNGGYIHQLKLI